MYYVSRVTWSSLGAIPIKLAGIEVCCCVLKMMMMRCCYSYMVEEVGICMVKVYFKGGDGRKAW